MTEFGFRDKSRLKDDSLGFRDEKGGATTAKRRDYSRLNYYFQSESGRNKKKKDSGNPRSIFPLFSLDQ